MSAQRAVAVCSRASSYMPHRPPLGVPIPSLPVLLLCQVSVAQNNLVPFGGITNPLLMNSLLNNPIFAGTSNERATCTHACQGSPSLGPLCFALRCDCE